MTTILGLLCAAGLSQVTEQEEKPEAKAPPPPLSEPILPDAALESGLAALGNLLIEDPATKPVYARIKAAEDSRMVQMGSQFPELIQDHPQAPELAGNGWFLRAISHDGQEYNELTNGLTLWQASTRDAPEDPLSQITWEPAPAGAAAKDSATLAAWVRAQMLKLATGEGGEDDRQSYYDSSSAPQSADYLAWAAMFYRSGEKAAALDLARASLERLEPPARAAFLDGIVQRVAGQRFNAAMEGFAKTRDWSALERDLNALIARFPRGWKDRAAVQVLALKIRDRIQAGAAAETITLPAEIATPYPWAAQELTAWIQRLEKGSVPSASQAELSGWDVDAAMGGSNEPTLWTLPALARQSREEEGEEGTAPPAPAPLFPASRGLQAVPVLAALLTDSTLTTVTPADYSNSFYGHSMPFELDDEEDSALTREQVQHAFQNLRRPVTRAELAEQHLLTALPPALQSSLHQMEDPGSKRDEILGWYRRVKDLDETSLAMLYLAENGLHQLWGTPVLEFLVTSTDPKIHTELENMLLESTERGYGRNEPLVTYLSARGEAGRPFLERAKKRILDESAEQIAQNPDYKQYIDSSIKSLERALRSGGGGALDEMLDELVKGETDFREVYQLLNQSLAKLKGPEVVAKILPRLPEMKDAQTGHYLLNSLEQHLPLNGTAEEKRQILADYRATWEALLKLPESPDDETAIWGPLTTVLKLDPAAKPGSAEGSEMLLRTLYAANPDATLKAGRERALTLLAGESPAPLPDPAAVPEPRRAAIVTELSAVPGEEVLAKLRGYSLEESAAVQEYLGELKEWPASLRDGTARIAEVTAKEVADAATWDAWKGKVLNAAALQDLVRQTAAEAHDRAMVLNLIAQSSLDGWKLSVVGQPQKDEYSGNVAGYYQQAMGEEVEIPETAKILSLMQVQIQSATDDERGRYGPRLPVFLDQDIEPKVPDGELADLDAAGRLAHTLKTFWERIKTSETSQGPPWRGRFYQESAPAAWLREEPESPDITF